MIRTERGSTRSQFCQIWNPTAGQSRTFAQLQILEILYQPESAGDFDL
jgi:hypothetical protein